jgi:probable phosphoglycerate mutase
MSSESTTFFLVRHAAHDVVDRILVGRGPGVHLGAVGKEQGARLGRRFSTEAVTAVHSSPRERAQETAQFVAEGTGVPIQTIDAIDEIDCGEWTGFSFDQLHDDAQWRWWNEERDVARTPGGESMAQVQQRIVNHLMTQRAQWSDGRIVLVSHADVIKAALLHILGLPLGAYQRIQIDPASISTVVLGNWGSKVLAMNESARA